jgi:hypothetical protein
MVFSRLDFPQPNNHVKTTAPGSLNFSTRCAFFLRKFQSALHGFLQGLLIQDIAHRF